jgi:crotonobetainyl-CoA:carnitine CoA-transferase CaiB-like acyl-CoA transferase
VLDLGILIPPALTSAKLVPLGADVGRSHPRHPALWRRRREPAAHGAELGQRSIALDLRDADNRATFLRLAAVADVIVENQLTAQARRCMIACPCAHVWL